MDTVTINGIEYAPVQTGNRCIVVVDRGWIFAGDIAEDDDYITLSSAVWVFRWEQIGFDGVIKNPEKAEIRKLDNWVQIPKQSVIFKIPVAPMWGL